MAKTILLAEDDTPLRTFLSELLAEQGGFEVRAAANGKEALALVEGGLAFDALLTDRRMPLMGGEALIAALRSRGCKQCMVLMTGDIIVPDHVPGADMVVHKPMSIIDLIEELQRRT